jgi:diaminopimelate epimerase
MKINFSKYHGTGNDFIMIDNRDNGFIPVKALVEKICDRHLGVGADGMILLTRQSGQDFGMSYYNSDGSESTMCGNGGRCITAFAHRLGIISEKARFFATDGIHEAMILDYGVPESRVKVRLIDTVAGPTTALGTFINTGSPHLVRFVTDIEKLDVVKEGRRIRYGKKFLGEGVNVDFVDVSRDTLIVRTYERGVEDETLSCGTGVTAAALVTASKFNPAKSFYHIKTPGGDLKVTFRQNKNSFSDIWLEGPVTFVFDGEFTVS